MSLSVYICLHASVASHCSGCAWVWILNKGVNLPEQTRTAGDAGVAVKPHKAEVIWHQVHVRWVHRERSRADYLALVHPTLVSSLFSLPMRPGTLYETQANPQRTNQLLIEHEPSRCRPQTNRSFWIPEFLENLPVNTVLLFPRGDSAPPSAGDERAGGLFVRCFASLRAAPTEAYFRPCLYGHYRQLKVQQ